MSHCPFITIKRSKVPEYLHLSELYLSLNPEEKDDEFAIPADCMKYDLIIRGTADLENLLLTMRYWILESFPSEVIEVITRSRNAVMVVELLSKFTMVFPGVRGLIKYIYKMGIDKACNLSAKFGRVDFLDFFAKEQNMLDMKTLRIAAKNGHVPCLSYCYDFLRQNGPVDLVSTDWRKVIENGNYECLSFLVEKGVPVSLFLSLALQLSSAKCLKYLHEKCKVDCWGPATMAAAASKGKLKLVEQLHEQDCPWDESAIIAALQTDEHECFEFFTKQRGIPTSVAFTNIDLPWKCGLVLLRHKIDELEVRQKRDYDVLYQLLQRVQKTKVTKVVLSKPKIRPVSHPRWK